MDLVSYLVSNVYAAAPPPGYSDPTGNTPLKLFDLDIVFSKVVFVIIAFTGMVLFLMFILSGIKFITAGGEPQKLESAKKTLTYAVFGVVLITCAYLIMKIIEVITGVPVSLFSVYTL